MCGLLRVAEGCVQPFREGAEAATEVVAFHLYLLRCGLRWLEGQVRMFGEGACAVLLGSMAR